MTNQVIPNEAVDAAIDALVMSRMGDYNIEMPEFRRTALKILEAAAPHMQPVPRTITTEDALDALPVGSIVAMIGSAPDAPAVACRAVLGWQFLGGDPERRYQSSALMPSPEPITVLHEPSPTP